MKFLLLLPAVAGRAGLLGRAAHQRAVEARRAGVQGGRGAVGARQLPGRRGQEGVLCEHRPGGQAREVQGGLGALPLLGLRRQPRAAPRGVRAPQGPRAC